jgi:hypothetical protein
LTAAGRSFQTGVVVPPGLRVALLGELSLCVGDAALPPLESGRAESLLAYLVLHRDAPQPRARIAGLLWPDSSEAQAPTNLRHVLHTLRHSLPESDRHLETTPRTLRWHGPLDLDVARFEDALARGGLEEAVDAYAGDLLEGSYDAWVIPHSAGDGGCGPALLASFHADLGLVGVTRHRRRVDDLCGVGVLRTTLAVTWKMSDLPAEGVPTYPASRPRPSSARGSER